MKRVLFFEKSDPVIFELAKFYSEKISQNDDEIIIWSFWRKSNSIGKLKIINYLDITTEVKLNEIESNLEIPIWKCLACERSFFDFTYHNSNLPYTRNSIMLNESLIEAISCSIWGLFNNLKFDLVIEGLKDNFITAIGVEIAKYMNVEFVMIRHWSIWKNSFHLMNKTNQTSSLIDCAYEYYSNNSNENEFETIAANIKKEYFRANIIPNDNLKKRLELIIHKYKSYEVPSLYNFLYRKVQSNYGLIIAKYRYKTIQAKDLNFKFVLYGLHVMPEASILGSNPELAHQFDIIRNLSLGMPWGVKLLCKLHPGDKLGKDINIDFLDKITALPNVEILSNSVKLDFVLKSNNLLAIATINGTIGIDGLINRLPVFLFGDTIFSQSDYFIKPKSVEEIWLNTQLILQKKYIPNIKSGVAILKALDATRIKGNLDISIKQPWFKLFCDTLYLIENNKSDFEKNQSL